MARFDNNERFDSEIRYDETAFPPPQPESNIMAKQVKIGLKRKPNTVIIDKAKALVTAIDGNPNFPTPNPTLVNFQAAIDLAEASLNARIVGETEQAARVAKENEDVRALYGRIVALANHVQDVSGGDEQKILSAGFAVRDQPSSPQPLAVVLDFLATAGDDAGEIDLTWSPVKYARGYQVECKLHNDAGVWAPVKFGTKSKMTVTGLTSGTTYAFRMRAVGSAGEGPWSDESVKLAP